MEGWGESIPEKCGYFKFFQEIKKFRHFLTFVKEHFFLWPLLFHED